ncbi:hypothetical protein [Mycobacteroides chelonae]|uniref:DUF7373 family lipoprotein n=1 Tax=Mycobacteroides chelonae TaxID=1774 RepID=UPI000AF0F118|nr:hypothetical protein [Mycobacteroides chelonae]
MMRRFHALAIALMLTMAACTSPPNGIEIVTNGETPMGPTPSTTTTATTKPRPTVPLPPPTGNIGDVKLKYLFYEAIRLSGSIVAPTIIDGRFNSTGWPTLLYRRDKSDELLDYGYVTGISISREPVTPNNDATTLLGVKIRLFKDEASAAAATEALFSLRNQLDPGESKRVETVEIPGFPAAKAYATHKNYGQSVYAETVAYLQRGPLVVRVDISQQPDVESAEILSRYLTRQFQELEHFTPTPIEQLSSLTSPFDPDGSLLKLATDKTSFNPSGSGAVFDARGAALFHSDIPAWLEIYRETGVDRFIVADSARVTRAGDDMGAKRLLDALRPEFLDRTDYGPPSAPSTVPNAECLQYKSGTGDDPLLTCLFQQGRYVAWVQGTLSVIGQRVQDQRNRLS